MSSSSSLPLPPSSSLLLNRVKQFLPLMKKANDDLEELIKTEGIDSVRIDSDMLNNTSPPKIVVLHHDTDTTNANDATNDTNDTNDTTNAYDTNNANDNSSNDDNSDKKVIQLEFALGSIISF